METDLTISELVADPLIAMMIEADGVSIEDLQVLLQNATKAEVERLQVRLHERHASEFYRRLDEKARVEEALALQGQRA